MELFPTNQDTPSLPYLRITTKLLSIFKIKLFPPHPSVAPSSQVDRNNPSWDLGRLFKAALLRDDIQPPLLSHWGSWDRCQHTPSHVCHCINLQGEAERVGSFLKKVLRWRTKGNLPPGNKTRASWHCGVCYCTHRLGAVLIQHLAAPYHTAHYLPKRAAFTERERQQWLFVCQATVPCWIVK